MSTSKAIEVVVITPERQVLAETAEAVVLPAHDGELGVLFDRAPLLCELGIGQLRYTQGGQVHRLFVDGGFAQVLQNHVTVLTSRALLAAQITPDVVKAADAAIAQHAGVEPDTLAARTSAQRRCSVLRAMADQRSADR